jgi:hypothetical protein
LNEEQTWFLSKLMDYIKWDYFLPKYKVEVVIDTVMSIFIEEIINSYFSANGEKIKFVSKEFPLKRDWNRQSVNPDFLLSTKNTLYIVELKTASDSYNEDQLIEYLKVKDRIEFKNHNGKYLIDDFKIVGNIEKTVNKNRHEVKYQKFYETIESTLKELDEFRNINRVEIVFIVPTLIAEQFDSNDPITYISLSEISKLSLQGQLNESGVKVWKEVKDLFEFIDGVDESLGID